MNVAAVRRATTFTPEEIVVKLRGEGVPLAAAERAAGLRDPAGPPLRDEDDHVAAGDRLMRALGFEVVRLSQKRKSKVTQGLPDRRYYSRRRHFAFWWEAKSATGEQRLAQQQFQQMCDETGDAYALGTYDELCEFLVARSIIARRDLPARNA